MTSAARARLQLFRTQKMLDGTAKDIAILAKFGVPYELLDVDGCVAVEPALGLVREKIAGGLRLPGDETGDCFKFTSALAAVCRQQGVEFRNGTRIDGILTEARQGHRRRSPTRAPSPATPTSWRWAATRRCCCARSGSTCRSTRSRATR